MKTLISIHPSSIYDLDRRESWEKVYDRRLDGFFDQVITIHPRQPTPRVRHNHTRKCYTYDLVKGQQIEQFPEGEVWVRAGDPARCGLEAYKLRRDFGVPYVVYIGANYQFMHDRGWFLPGRLKWTAFKFGAKKILRAAHKVYGANDDNARWAAELSGRPVETIRKIGIHPLFYVEPKREEPIADCLHVSRLSKEYFPYIVDVINACEDARATLTIAGDGPYRKELQNLSNPGIVTFLGWQTSIQLHKLYRSHRLHVSPYGGSTIVEAALCGLPTVGYRMEWLPEFLYKTDMIEEGDWQGLAMLIEDILDDPGDSKLLGDIYRKKALQMYDYRKLIEQERRLFS